MRAGEDPKRAGRGRLAIWFGAGLVAVGLGGGGGLLWLSAGSPRQTVAAKPASAATDPVLVPRRRHPPQVVEPVAGVVGGQTAEEQLHIDTRPATAAPASPGGSGTPGAPGRPRWAPGAGGSWRGAAVERGRASRGWACRARRQRVSPPVPTHGGGTRWHSEGAMPMGRRWATIAP